MCHWPHVVSCTDAVTSLTAAPWRLGMSRTLASLAAGPDAEMLSCRCPECCDYISRTPTCHIPLCGDCATSHDLYLVSCIPGELFVCLLFDMVDVVFRRLGGHYWPTGSFYMLGNSAKWQETRYSIYNDTRWLRSWRMSPNFKQSRRIVIRTM